MSAVPPALAVLALTALAGGADAQTPQRLGVGDEVPPLGGTDTEGAALGWHRFEDRAVILYFHSARSRFSARILGELTGLLAKDAALAGHAAILVVGDTTDDEPVETALQALEMPRVITVVPDRDGFQRYRAVAFPTAYTIGRDRRVVHVSRGYGPLFATRVAAATRFAAGLIDRAQLDQVLAPTAPHKEPDLRVTPALRLADRLATSGLFDEARRTLTTALERAPSSTELLEALAGVELGAGKADSAAEHISRLELVTGRNPATRMLRAELHVLLNDPAAAERELQGLPVTTTRMAMVKGKVLEQLGRYAEAAALYREALERILRENAGR